MQLPTAGQSKTNAEKALVMQAKRGLEIAKTALVNRQAQWQVLA